MSDAGTAPRGVGVVVVAAGSGTRLGAGIPKAFVDVGGRRIVDWAVDGARAVPGVVHVVVVVPPAHVEMPIPPRRDVDVEPDPELTEALYAGAAADRVPVTVVAGGAERSDSVRAGLAALGTDIDIVLVHDAARCFTPAAVYERVIAAVVAGDRAVVPGLAVVDTMKVVGPDGLVVYTPDRSRVRAIQTPQGFARVALEQAHASGVHASDDAMLAEECGIPVRVVDGDPLAFKVTTPADLDQAHKLLASAPTLWVIGGLPGTGKTTAGRVLAAEEGATHLRVDSIEVALLGAGVDEVTSEGYAALYAVARDQLRLGGSVVADLVNPIPLTREALRAVARDAGASIREIQLVCSDAAEHRRRVENRAADIPGHRLPTWADVEARQFEAWPESVTIDTAGLDVEAIVRQIRGRVPGGRG
ncbi:MAG TPA: 2-C-methyl-D-erythritol 4-phosphate cytidylyltransferase [Tetrasphaera sp.]|nr:2-C-methyl-D-erythritol 4-phosphate cytidylyltransferase [Tetrasphaera sp.]